MKVYFTASTAEYEKYKDTYKFIKNHLISNGHTLTRDWIPHVERKITQNDIQLDDIKEIYEVCVDSIKLSDLVIIDDTVSNFSTGHQITLALQYKKPTLVLWQGEKHKVFQKMFIHGIKSPLLQVSMYDEKTLESVLGGFISKFESINTQNRFHLVLNGAERQYLDWVQMKKNKSRTLAIREALQDAINNDSEYLDYLSR